MHYGNQNTKRFMIFVIIVLFIGGFIKGIFSVKQKTSIVEPEQTKIGETIGK